MKAVPISVLFTLLISGCFSQTVFNSFILQDSLGKLSTNIWKQKTDSARMTLNDEFCMKFQSVLQSELASAKELDSIPGITCIKSDDGEIRLFTWNVPLSDGTNRYYGFIQLMKNDAQLIPLKSAQPVVNHLSTEILSPQNWYGAIYYKIIVTRTSGRTLYTLLGWDGLSPEMNRKIIDIMAINPDGNIAFGMPVFKTAEGIKARILMEYAAKANMVMRYDYQAIRVEKRNKIRKEKNWLIVTDRLVPMDPSLAGMRKYYVPSGDIYDGFVFQNDYWVFVEDIDVSNTITNDK